MVTDSQTDTLQATRDKMTKAVATLKKEFAAIRAGRANAQILDRIMVDYYNTPTPIPQMANISSPEPRLLVISLWDSAMIKNVEKAIQQSNIGINPTNDGKVIRLLFPELTEERRKELVKSAHRMAEENRVVIRTIRRDAIEDLNRQKKANLLTEDDLKQEEKDVQKITDDFIKDIDLIMSEKEKEILAI
jgi:ribosome recycling factor